MNSIRSICTKLLSALIILIILSGCGKDNISPTDLKSSIVGKWNATSVDWDGFQFMGNQYDSQVIQFDAYTGSQGNVINTTDFVFGFTQLDTFKYSITAPDSAIIIDKNGYPDKYYLKITDNNKLYFELTTSANQHVIWQGTRL